MIPRLTLVLLLLGAAACGTSSAPPATPSPSPSPSAFSAGAFPIGKYQRNVVDLGAHVRGAWTLEFDAVGNHVAQQPGQPAIQLKYSIKGEQITLSGQAGCIGDGVYTWTYAAGALTFHVVGVDGCGDGGRRQSILTDGPWTRQ